MQTATTPSKTAWQPKDVYQMVTDTIIEQLELGTIPWKKPWTGGKSNVMQLPYNLVTGNAYRGINIVLLWSSAIKHDYQSSEWASFRQWQKKKEMIRKGEKGNLIVFYDKFEKEVDGEIKKIPFLKSSVVFNRCQLASYELTKELVETIEPALFELIDPVDDFIANTQAIIEQHDGGACYIPSNDKIMMPYTEQFKPTAGCTATEGFYSVLFHELTHWTGAKHRLDRINHKKFGDQNYAAEELIAEFGAAFLCAGFGIATTEKENHAAYIDHWLKVLKENNRCIVTAASEASKAVDYLYKLC